MLDMQITPTSGRAARCALWWTVATLGNKAGVSPNTVAKFENGDKVLLESIVRIQDALEAAGVTFLRADDVSGPGVRVRRSVAAPAMAS